MGISSGGRYRRTRRQPLPPSQRRPRPAAATAVSLTPDKRGDVAGAVRQMRKLTLSRRAANASRQTDPGRGWSSCIDIVVGVGARECADDGADAHKEHKKNDDDKIPFRMSG